MIAAEYNINSLEPLADFLKGIQNDPRIGAIHIAVFLAFYCKWLSLSCPVWVEAFAYEIMPVAKVSSRMTYYQIIEGLRANGYIKYKPSRHKGRGSKVCIRIKG